MRRLVESVTALFSPTDEQAMWRVHTQDDPHAFALLMHRWEAPIQRLCTRMLGDAHRGEDLTQDAFARLFAKRKEYQPSGRFSTFLWRVALNLCYDELRRMKRRSESPLLDDCLGADDELPVFASIEATPDRALLQEEESAMVRRAVLGLSEAFRSVVILRHYEGLKFREIADVLGIPEGTVKSRMAEALIQLEKALARDFQPARTTVLCKPRKSIRPSLVL
jgi:RNA polymerase sigma-70 factor (ECF subfamily)